MLDNAQIKQIINDFQDPSTEIKLGETNLGIMVAEESGKQIVSVVLRYPVKGYIDELNQSLTSALQQAGADNVNVVVSSEIIKHKVQQGVQAPCS